MTHPSIKRALISVYDKTGVVDFARRLHQDFGIEIISTGGTASLLEESGVPVTPVEAVTGFPEMMNGRVKTLHPKIHAALLADRDNPEHIKQLAEQGIEPIDMVVVNLYPFEKTIAEPDCTFEQAIEMIDIGGPTMLRSAAKNHKHVLVICDPDRFEPVLAVLRSGDAADLDAARVEGALHVFSSTCHYDGKITSWLGAHIRGKGKAPGWLSLQSRGQLRYGENPHQTGELQETNGNTFGESTLIHTNTEADSTLSYNNYADGHAALELCKELTRGLCRSDAGGASRLTHDDRSAKDKINACAFIKHTNACGAAIASDPVEAYQKAYLGDPNAAMGGILACSFPVDAAFSEAVMETYARWGKEAGAGGFFIEVWIAPAFDEDAISVIRSRKKWGERVRLLGVGDLATAPEADSLEYKSLTGGMLVQGRDLVGLNEAEWKVATKRTPTDAEMADLRLAWLVGKHTKSNAITLCKDSALIGNGAGQMSRVMSCRIAAWLAKENGHADQLAGSVASSDAFFPFPDGPTILMESGVTAIIQPGGSKRDGDTIQACDERGVAMILTGTRHFRH